jgi:dynactin 1
MADLLPGQAISLPDGRRAVVRFIGATHFADGDWIGIELDEATGKNDGAVQGERYFDCEQGYGMFIRPSAVAAVLEEPSRDEGRKVGMNGALARGRPPSGALGGNVGVKRQSGLSTSAAKRHSSNASSPSPAPRMGPPARPLRVRSIPLSLYSAVPADPVCT